MAQCYINNLETTLDAALGTGDTTLTLPAAVVTQIEAALLDDGGIFPPAAWSELHYVPLTINNGTTIEVVRAWAVATSTTVSIVRGPVPIAADSGAAVVCSVAAPYATLGQDVMHVESGPVAYAVPGARVVCTATDASLFVSFQYIDGTATTTRPIQHDELEAMVEFHNTAGTARTLSFFWLDGSPVVRWLGGTAQTTIASGVKVAVYRFRLVLPTSSRASVGQVLASAEFYS